MSSNFAIKSSVLKLQKPVNVESALQNTYADYGTKCKKERYFIFLIIFSVICKRLRKSQKGNLKSQPNDRTPCAYFSKKFRLTLLFSMTAQHRALYALSLIPVYQLSLMYRMTGVMAKVLRLTPLEYFCTYLIYKPVKLK